MIKKGRGVKKFACLGLLLLLAVSLAATGCGGGAATDKEKSGAKDQAAAKADKPAVKIDMKLCGADPGAGGVWDLMGGGVAQTIKKGMPGSSVTLVPGGGVSDVNIVTKSAEPMMGLTHSVIAVAAENGADPFKQKITNVKALFSMYVTKQQIAVTEDFPLNSFKEIVEKKYPLKAAVDEPGSTQHLANQRMFELLGASYKDVESWGGKIYLKGQEEGSHLMGDGVVNCFPILGPAPQGPIQEVSATHKIRFLKMDQDLIDRMCSKYGYSKEVVPKSAYPFLKEDYQSFGSRVIIIANDVMTNDQAYAIVKAMCENIEYLRGVHANLRELTPQLMASGTGIKLHPGAEKYYKEVGAIK